MKIRTDFITNSSSSSFICVRVNSKLKEKILKENGLDEDSVYEKWRKDYFEDLTLKGNLTCAMSDGEISYIGLDIALDLYDKTVREHEKELIDILDREYDIKATEKDISFDYGEICNG